MAINDGGSAFPMQDHQAIHDYAMARIVGIEDTDERDRLYTLARADAVAGMSLRDAMAIAALQGICANPGGPFQACDQSGWRIVNCDADDIAREAYGLADAMIRARTQEQEQS